MIPIRDHTPSGRPPIVTYFFIVANVGVAVYMFGLSPVALERFIYQYSVIPAQIVAGENLISLFTSMFLHGGLGHLFSNMLFLHIFGDNLEDRFGHLGFIIFYLVCGLGAAGLQILFYPQVEIPMLGASGAIAGVMGGYLVLFPRNKIDILFSFGFFFRRATVPAYFMLFYWFAFQLLFGATSLVAMEEGMGGIAYFAHVGGFGAGWIITKLTEIKKRD